MKENVRVLAKHKFFAGDKEKITGIKRCLIHILKHRRFTFFAL